MIDKSLNKLPAGEEQLPEMDSIEIVVEGEEVLDGTEIDLSDSPDVVPKSVKNMLPFNSNIAEILSEKTLLLLGSTLLEDIEDDLQSRKDWEETYKKGLGLLGLKIEERTEPWQGACGIHHPILAEAVVRFQAETIMETYPPAGPVKTKVIGDLTPEKEKAAKRVKDDMNHEITDVMTEYRNEHERLLWALPIAGSAFKKVYYDSILKRQTSMFIPAEDFIMSYGASDLQSCPRYSQRLRMTVNDFERAVTAKVYREIDLGDPTIEKESIRVEKDKISGVHEVKESRYTFYESHVELFIEGFDVEGECAKPYIVTIESSTGKVLSIYRNWEEGDESYKKRQHFVSYTYIPGFGSYGLGLIHLVGGFAQGATSILRQLVDAGTLSNLPGGLKTKGLRIKGDNTPIAPGEWRDADVLSGALKDNLLPMPYKDPSAVLAALLKDIVDEGRKFAAVAEMKIADFDSKSPVGTTMALLERTLKVMSAVQARIYESMKQELRLIKNIIRDYTDMRYSYDPEGASADIKKQDYEIVDILPVADPNSATMSQRIVQYQAVMQLAAMAPQIYSLPDLHSQMLDILGVKNVEKLIPSIAAKMNPTDPITENMNILKMQPVKAFYLQDHESHIKVHMAAMQDPKIMQMIGQNPQAQAIASAANAHLMEHIGFAYRNQIEKTLGTKLPPPDEQLPPEIEVQLSGLMAAAADKLLNNNKADVAQQQAQEQMKDPIIQIQMQELEIKKVEVKNKHLKDLADIELREKELAQKAKAADDKNNIDKFKSMLSTTVENRRIDESTEKRKSDQLSNFVGKVIDKSIDVRKNDAKSKPEKGGKE